MPKPHINQKGYGRNASRWRCNVRPDAACLKNTKSEAKAWFKKLLGVNRLPKEANVEKF